jgi:hypothetical protein
MVKDIEEVILRSCPDSQVVKQSEKLCAMNRAVIGHMEKHLPQDEIFVLSLLEWSYEQHVVPQLG